MSLSPIANAVVFENMQEAVIVVDGQNQVVKVNPAAEDLLTAPQEKLIGQSIQALFHDQPQLIEEFQYVTQITTELVVNGRYFELRISPLVEDGILRGRVIVLHEITTYKLSAQALKQQSERLSLLYQITTHSKKTLEEKLHETLELTTKALEMEIGIISRIVGKSYTVKHLYTTESGIVKGQVFSLGSTYCQITLASNKVFCINHVKQSPYAHHPCYVNTGLEAYIGTSISVNGRLYGTLNFSSSKRRQKPFQQADKEFVKLLANWIQSALEHDQANTNLLANLTRIQALYQVAQSLIRYADLPDFLQTVADGIAIALPANRVTLIILDTENKKLDHLIRGGKGADHIQNVSYEEVLDGLTGWVIKEKRGTVSSKEKPDPRESPTVQKRRIETNCGSILVAPVRYQSQMIGTITAINTPEERAFNLEDLALLEALAGQTAVTIENRRLLDSERARTQQLEASNQRLDTFSHMVAHDLKSPLALILGYTEFLIMDEPRDNPDVRLQRILNSAKKMGHIIDELLLLASIQQKQIQTSPIAMTFIVDEAISRLRLMIEEKNAQIKLPSLWPIARGYAPWVEEVWVNYISNALKYGGTPPSIELGAAELEQEQICFWVKDNGQTITLEDEARLFQKFERLDQTKATGHGLGLSIVKQIIEMLDGRVGFKRLPEQGSMFYFTLPVASFEDS